MSVSMIHESNAFALPAEDEDDMDSIFFIIGLLQAAMTSKLLSSEFWCTRCASGSCVNSGGNDGSRMVRKLSLRI